jgi:hypothetical protein
VTLPTAKFSHRVDGAKIVLRLEQLGNPMEFPVTVRLTYRSGREHSVVLIARETVTEQTVELLEPLKSVAINADYGSLVDIR